MWLKKNDYATYQILYGAYKSDNCYGNKFDAQWKKTSESNKDKFFQLQYEFMKVTYFSNVNNYFKEKYNLDFNKKTKTLQSVILSTAIKNGVNKTIDILLTQDLSKSDTKIISGIYQTRKNIDIYVDDTNENTILNMLDMECSKALAMLKKESK
jgi:hypothetical protein